MRDSDIRDEVIEWLRTGQTRGLKLGMTESECITLLGNPEDVWLVEYVQYTYKPFELFFRNTADGESNERVLTNIVIENPDSLRKIFKIKRGIFTIRPTETIDFLDYYNLKHDSKKSLVTGYIYPPPTIITDMRIKFYFMASQDHDLFLQSIDQDINDYQA